MPSLAIAAANGNNSPLFCVFNDMKCRSAKYAIVALAAISIALYSCSTKKNTAGSRFFQAFTTRYNVYFNGETHYEEELKKWKRNTKTIIPISSTCILPSRLPTKKPRTCRPISIGPSKKCKKR